MPIVGTSEFAGFGEVNLPPTDAREKKKKGLISEFFDPNLAAAHLRRENLIGRAATYQFDKREHDGDPNFDRLPHIEGYEDQWEAFIQDNTPDEIELTKARLARKHQDKQMIMNAGFGGIAQGMILGNLDPSIFVPGSAYYKLAQNTIKGSMLKSAALRMAHGAGGAALSVGAQELGLQILDTDNDRSFDESVANIIGASMLSGGISAAWPGLKFGFKKSLDGLSYLYNYRALAGALNGKNQTVHVDSSGNPIVSQPKTTPYNPLSPHNQQGASAGAMGTSQAQKLQPGRASGLGESLDKGLSHIPGYDSFAARFGTSDLAKKVEAKWKASPVWQGINNNFRTAQRYVGDLLESVIETAENTSGHTKRLQVETRVDADRYRWAQVEAKVEELYNQYLDVNGWFKRIKGNKKVKQNPNLLSRSAFDRAIGVANQNGDVHPNLNIPQINEAAKLFRESIGNYIKERAQKTGRLNEDPELALILGSKSYLPRHWNYEQIGREPLRFQREVLEPMFERANARIARGETVYNTEGRRLMSLAQKTQRHAQERRIKSLDKLKTAREKRKAHLEKRLDYFDRKYQASETRRKNAQDRMQKASSQADIQRASDSLDRLTGFAKNAQERVKKAQSRVDAQQFKIDRIEKNINQAKAFYISPQAERLRYQAKSEVRRFLDPEDFDLEAADIIDNILNFNDIHFTNAQARKSNPGHAAWDAFKSRTLDIDDVMHTDWLNTNAREVWGSHYNGINPLLHLDEYYQERGWNSLADGLKELKNEADNLIARAPEAEKNAIREQAKRARDLMIDTEAMILGTIGQGSKSDIDRALRFGRAVNAWRLSGKVLLSAYSDLGTIVGANGVKSFVMDGLVPLARDMIHKTKNNKLAREMLQDAAIGIEAILPTRFEHLRAALEHRATELTKFERANLYVGSFASRFNLMHWWTSFWESVYGHMSSSRMLRALESHANGGTINPRDRKWLAVNGISEDLYLPIYNAWKNNGGNIVDGSFMSNLPAWRNTPEGKAFATALLKDTRATVIRATKGDIPRFTQKTEAGRALMNWRTFGFAATNKLQIPYAQRRDKETLQGVVALLALGSLIGTMRKAVKGEEIPWDDVNWFASEAMDNSGLLGILGEAKNIATKAHLVRLAGKPFGLELGRDVSRYESRNIASAVLGPVYGLPLELVDVLGGFAQNSDNITTQDFVKAGELVIPYSKLFYVNWLFRQAVRGTFGAMGYPDKD